MTLLLGLHAHGLGAVPLNWSVVNATDRKFHRVAKIPAHERIAMLVGCGHPTDDVVVPVSRRRPVDSILRWHQEKH